MSHTIHRIIKKFKMAERIHDRFIGVINGNKVGKILKVSHENQFILFSDNIVFTFDELLKATIGVYGYSNVFLNDTQLKDNLIRILENSDFIKFDNESENLKYVVIKHDSIIHLLDSKKQISIDDLIDYHEFTLYKLTLTEVSL